MRKSWKNEQSPGNVLHPIKQVNICVMTAAGFYNKKLGKKRANKPKVSRKNYIIRWKCS